MILTPFLHGLKCLAPVADADLMQMQRHLRRQRIVQPIERVTLCGSHTSENRPFFRDLQSEGLRFEYLNEHQTDENVGSDHSKRLVNGRIIPSFPSLASIWTSSDRAPESVPAPLYRPILQPILD